VSEVPVPCSVLSGFAAVCATACALTAAPSAHAGVGDVLVRFKPDASASERSQARRAADVHREQLLPVAGLELVDPDRGVSAERAVSALERDSDVLYAEVDRPRVLSAAADDALFGSQWGLQRIGAPAAWDVTTGTADALVAVIDSGVDPDHPDLAGNLVPGRDFVERDSVAQDENGHGTHVAGIVGARGNDGVGVAGVAWTTRMMPLRVLDEDGEGRVSDMVAAYAHAAQAGARVANLSFGGAGFSRAEHDALAAAGDVLFVAAAGNDGADDDREPFFPCAYDLANVICVTASDQADQLPSWANFGAESVDLAAPGTGIASTVTGRAWAMKDGTSMATPHVTGAAALLLDVQPAARPQDLAVALTATAQPAPAFTGRTASGGVLDADAALDAVKATPQPFEQPPAPPASEQPPAAPASPPAPPVAPSDPPVGPPVAPVTDGSSGQATTARLRIRSARVTHGRLRVRLALTEAAAGGRVLVLYRARGKTLRAWARVSASGRAGVARALPRKLRRARGTLTLRWAGSATVAPATARTRVVGRG
jgi:thermitase